MESDNQRVSRKHFLSWGAAVTAVLALPAFLRPKKKKKQADTVTMLTEDGRLVTIDICNIPPKKEHIKPENIHTWISRKKASL